jgi:hypothetical protein
MEDVLWLKSMRKRLKPGRAVLDEEYARREVQHRHVLTVFVRVWTPLSAALERNALRKEDTKVEEEVRVCRIPLK